MRLSSMYYAMLIALPLCTACGTTLDGGGNGKDTPPASKAVLTPASLPQDTWQDGFLVTDYTVALEANFSGAQVCHQPGLDGCYKSDFLCSGTGVAMQGTGLAQDGRYVKYVGGGNWCNGYNAPLCGCESATFEYASGVIGASGRILTADASIAVDPGVIPLGWYVWIDWFRRWFRADDTGGGISGSHVDVYTGASNPGYNLNSRVFVSDRPSTCGPRYCPPQSWCGDYDECCTYCGQPGCRC